MLNRTHNANIGWRWRYAGPCLAFIALVGITSIILVSILTARSRVLKKDINKIKNIVLPAFNLTMDERCNDWNSCTWDLISDDELHCENKVAINGIPCEIECLDAETTTCEHGECTGECIGTCENFLDCPQLPAHPFIPVVDFGGFGLCIFGKCVYAYFNIDDLFPVPSGICHQLHETNSNRGCTDLISQLSPYSECMQSTWCDFGLVDDVCLFSFECSKFNFGPELIAAGEEDPVISHNSSFPNSNSTIFEFINHFQYDLETYNYTVPTEV